MSHEATGGGGNPDTLPTFADMSGPCPRCGRVANFNLVNHQPLRILESMSGPQPGGQVTQSRIVEQATVIECMGCKGTSVVIEAEIGNQYGMKPVQYYPTDHLADLQRVAGVPAGIVEAYSEGVRCLSVQSPNAAAAMFRTTIAQIVQDNGSAAAKGKRTLKEAIKQMVQDKTLWDDFGDWADHIRDTGNAGAHGEAFDPVTMDQATELKRFTREMINFLYEQPARRAAARPVTRRGTGSANASGAPTTPPASGNQPPGTVTLTPGSGQA